MFFYVYYDYVLVTFLDLAQLKYISFTLMVMFTQNCMWFFVSAHIWSFISFYISLYGKITLGSSFYVSGYKYLYLYEFF